MEHGNASTYDLPPLPTYTIQPLPPLIRGFPDQYLTLLLPIIAYWAVSMTFHLIDHWDLFPQYRLHTPAEVLKRNHVSKWDVCRDVIIQQIVQTLFGIALAAVDPEPVFGKEEYDIANWARRIRMAQRAVPIVLGLIGVDAAGLAKNIGTSHGTLAGAISGGVYPDLTQTLLISGQPATVPAFADWELYAGKIIYHALIPLFQFVMAICVVDTWQYFLHRAMHMNKYLYTTFHARHHRLYVPYAYGALYNHPVEGFVLDTVGTGIAYLVSGMSVRQSMWFFTCTTIKTVDDHCGYAFPWDPLQHLTSNNAGYHDVHHQSWGIKTNFSQPFFTFWDKFLGTKWTGGDVSARYERAKIAAQKKVDTDAAEQAKSITKSTPTDSTTPTSHEPYVSHVRSASSTARTAHTVAEPRIPPGKATSQAISSRQQILDDWECGGVAALAQESVEEVAAQQRLAKQKEPAQPIGRRKRTTSSGLKGLADRVGESLHGKGTGVLGVESGRR